VAELVEARETAMKGYVYILLCSNGQYYTGSTNDIEKRLFQHQNGEGANFTKKHLPVELVYLEEFDRIDDAFCREKQVQGWSRKKKEALIKMQYDKLPGLSRNYTQYGAPSVTSTGSVAGKTGSVAGKTGSVAGKTGSVTGKTGSVTGKTGSVTGDNSVASVNALRQAQGKGVPVAALVKGSSRRGNIGG